MNGIPIAAHRDVATALAGFAVTQPRSTAVVDHRGAVTFGELWASTRQVARAVVSRGGPADRPVIIPSRSDAHFLVHVLGVLTAGRTPLPVPDRSLADVRRHLDRHPARGTQRCRPWRAVLCAATGRRSILLSHGEPPTAGRKAFALGMTPRGTALLASPLHLPGPFEFALRQVLIGGTVVLAAPFSPATWLAAAATSKATWAFVVPTQLSRILDAGPGAFTASTRSLGTLLHSSEPCPPPLRARLAKAIDPDRVAEYYGTAHYDGILQRPSPTADRLVGTPIPGARLRIVGPSGPLPSGQVGAIEGRSDVGLVHHGIDDPCPSPQDAWRGVGDRGLLHADGRLEVVSVAVPGRALVGGVNVALDDVRRVVNGHPAVRACTVTAVDDARYGQVVTATITPRGPRLTVQELDEHCRRRLESAARPQRITLSTRLEAVRS